MSSKEPEKGEELSIQLPKGRCVLGQRNCPPNALRQPRFLCLRYSKEACLQPRTRRGAEMRGSLTLWEDHSDSCVESNLWEGKVEAGRLIGQPVQKPTERGWWLGPGWTWRRWQDLAGSPWVSIALGHFNIEMLGRKREIKQWNWEGISEEIGGKARGCSVLEAKRRKCIRGGGLIK